MQSLDDLKAHLAREQVLYYDLFGTLGPVRAEVLRTITWERITCTECPAAFEAVVKLPELGFIRDVVLQFHSDSVNGIFLRINP